MLNTIKELLYLINEAQIALNIERNPRKCSEILKDIEQDFASINDMLEAYYKEMYPESK